MDQSLNIELPLAHPKQLEICESGAKRTVVNAGRRGGKTTLAASVSIEKMLTARRVLLASTTQEQADAFWDKCKSWLGEAVDAGLIEKNEQRRILSFPQNGGRIKVKTASDADTLRGDYADFLVLDECAMLAPNAWYEVGAPMLLDNDGDAWFISTPRRRNWFHSLYQKAKADESGRWQAWHFTSFDNPYLSQDALNEITRDLTEEAYKQEILAEFLEGEGSVFRNITACLTAPATTPLEHPGHSISIGVDWGMKKDSTVLSAVCSTCRREVELDRFNKIEWAFQRARLHAMVDRWHARDILAEENSIGGPNIEALMLEGLPVRAFTTTASSKPPLIQSLALAFERSECQWLDIPVATAELMAYESKISAQTGRISYGAPEGLTDDTVIARALAWWAISRAVIWEVA